MRWRSFAAWRPKSHDRYLWVQKTNLRLAGTKDATDHAGRSCTLQQSIDPEN